MTFAELRYKAAQSYMMALTCSTDDEADRLYAEGDRYNDMADDLLERPEPKALKLARAA